MGDVIRNQTSPDFRFPEVGVSELHMYSVDVYLVYSKWERGVKTAAIITFHTIKCTCTHLCLQQSNSYLERVYSLRPLCSRIAVNVPIQPRSLRSWPIFQVTKRGLKIII